MQIDFTKLTNEQKNLIIERLCNKFKTKDIPFNELAFFIDLYRRKRYESSVTKILEGDEILKGRIYGVSKDIIEKNKNKSVVIPKEEVFKEEQEIQEDTKEESSFREDMSPEELDALQIARQSRLSLTRIRESSFGENEFIPNSGIIFDDNITQVESEYTLREINNQLPQENLLDRFNFGYVNLRDDDDGTTRDSIGKRIQ